MSEWYFLIPLSLSIIGLTAALWKVVSVMSRMSWIGTRSWERERQGLHRLLEHHLDRQVVHPGQSLDLAAIQGQERMHEKVIDGEVEKEVASIPDPETKEANTDIFTTDQVDLGLKRELGAINQ